MSGRVQRMERGETKREGDSKVDRDSEGEAGIQREDLERAGNWVLL